MNTKETIEFFGSPTNLAEAIGITIQAVHQWKDTVPLGRRDSVRQAMKVRADKLILEARGLRKAAKTGGK